MIATKPTKKHEILFLFSRDFAGFVARNIPSRKYSFFIVQPGRCSSQRQRSCETTIQKVALVLSWTTLHFVGWVELAAGFFGFRCTQPNLHFASGISKYETQQRSISKSSPRRFFPDQTGRLRPAVALIGTILNSMSFKL